MVSIRAVRAVVRLALCSSLIAGIGEAPIATQYLAKAGANSAVRAMATGIPFIASIDTMKESMDTLNNRLTPAQIAGNVALSSRLHTNYITVDTPYDYPDYAQQWVFAIRAAGKHVWFRMSWNAWLGIYNTPATMTPTAFLNATYAYIVTHPYLFRPGDIFDICPEPEQGKYWTATYGQSWNWSPAPPSAATRDYNAFVRNGISTANSAFAAIGVSGVITTVRSMNPFIIEHDLEPATVGMMGQITADSYPEGATTDPSVAVAARLAELQAMHSVWQVPVVLGEMGYSTAALVSDGVQQAVLAAEFQALRTVPYLKGLNYWVGAGYPAPDQYNGTRLFSGTTGAWTPRPAASDLAAYFAAMGV